MDFMEYSRNLCMRWRLQVYAARSACTTQQSRGPRAQLLHKFCFDSCKSTRIRAPEACGKFTSQSYTDYFSLHAVLITIVIIVA